MPGRPGQDDACGDGGAGDHDAGRDRGLGRAGVPVQQAAAQPDPVHAAAWRDGAMCGGSGRRRARRPQRRQQQRRRGQRGPAASLPVGPVRGAGDRPKLGDQRCPVGRAAAGVLGQPGRHQRPQGLRDRLKRHRLGLVLAQQRLRRNPVERRPAGQALIERGRGRVHVGGRAGRAPGELLRRRVGQRPGRDGAVPGPGGDPEVGQLARPGPVDQHVLRLVVPVHHPAPVRGREAEQRALQDDERGLGRGLALAGQDVAERDPVDQLHHDRRPGRATPHTRTAAPRSGRPARPAPPPRPGTVARSPDRPADHRAGT